MLNATYDDDANVVTRHGAVHLGMATQTDAGLMVPVIRDAQGMSVWQLASEIAAPGRSRAQRQGDARGADRLDHHHFSLGTDGRHRLDPGDQPPAGRDHRGQQGAGNAGDRRRRARGAQVHEPVAVSCDHRVVDGWDAASFLQAISSA